MGSRKILFQSLNISNFLTDRQTQTDTDRQTQTDTDKQTDRHKRIHTDRHKRVQTNGQTHTHTESRSIVIVNEEASDALLRFKSRNIVYLRQALKEVLIIYNRV